MIWYFIITLIAFCLGFIVGGRFGWKRANLKTIAMIEEFFPLQKI